MKAIKSGVAIVIDTLGSIGTLKVPRASGSVNVVQIPGDQGVVPDERK